MFTAALIKAESSRLHDYVQACYRHLHRHPETAHFEIETNRFIRQELDRMGVYYETPAENITIAILKGHAPGATVGLRCDTDALPVQEETGLDFASEVPGKMHACGHDGHTALGLGVAQILHDHPECWCGTAKIIFQPAEEGEDGAGDVIRTGRVNDLDVIYGLHLWSAYPTCTLHAAPVTVSAAVNMFEVRVTGKGGHGATPDKCADALVAAAEMVGALQTIISRRFSPMEPGVLTIGSFHAGHVGNIIAQDAVLKGTLRTLNNQTRTMAENAMADIIHGIARMHGCTAEINNRRMSDAVTNDPRAVSIAQECGELLGCEMHGQNTLMLGDDFSTYGSICPYAYLQLGIADEQKQSHYAHHNGHFRIDEDALPLGVAWLAMTVAKAAECWNA